MGFQSFDELRSHLDESLAQHEKRLSSLDNEADYLNSGLASARQSLGAVQAPYDEARRAYDEARNAFVEASRRRDKEISKVKDFERRVAGVPVLRSRLEQEAKALRMRIAYLHSRAEPIQSRCCSDTWKSLFAADCIADMNDEDFAALLAQVESMAAATAKWHAAAMLLKKLAAETPLDGEGFRNLAKAAEDASESEKALESARADIIDIQLEALYRQLRAMPKLPPAASEDAHDITLSKTLRVEKEVRARREALDKAWPKSPDLIRRLFFDETA